MPSKFIVKSVIGYMIALIGFISTSVIFLLTSNINDYVLGILMIVAGFSIATIAEKDREIDRLKSQL